MQFDPSPYAVCPSPRMVSSRALPSSATSRLAPRYGVAGSYRVPTTSTVGLVAAVRNGPVKTPLATTGLRPHGSSPKPELKYAWSNDAHAFSPAATNGATVLGYWRSAAEMAKKRSPNGS